MLEDLLSRLGISETHEFEEIPEVREAEECAVSYSECGFNMYGGYVPGRVTEVSEDAEEADESVKELSEEIDSWIHQGEKRSCAVACQTMIQNQTSDRDKSEKELIERGHELNVYNNGTAPSNEGAILRSYGYDVQRTETAGREELVEAANEGGTKVILHIDSIRMAYPHLPGEITPDHAVQLLHVEKTPDGEMAIINDPDMENGAGLVYPMEILMKAWNGDMTMVRKGEAV